VFSILSCKKKRVEDGTLTYLDSSSSPELTVFKAPEEAPKNNTFSVYVRYEGGEWIDLHEYDAEVDGGNLKVPIYHMAFVSFDADFSKKIEVKVQKNNGSMSNVSIRPDIEGIKPTNINDNTITFSLTRPGKVSVEVNGDLHNNLMVFANRPEENPVAQGTPNVYYYGPGIHKIGGNGQGTITLKSNDKVYIAGGAIVYGNIEGTGVDNVSISGRGILCGGMYTDHAYPHTVGKNLIKLENSTNINIEGITLLNTVSWNVRLNFCNTVSCKNMKLMGWTINSDGINPVASRDVVIDDCFIRGYDDCISIKGSYAPSANPLAKDTKNITVQNCILWIDQGRAVAIGPESYSTELRLYENINFKNIDVLYNENYNVEWAKGAISILIGDDATARNVKFEDVRVDRLGLNTNFITIAILQSTYNVSPGKRIENITFNRVSLNTTQQPLQNRIWGYDATKKVSGVTFSNLKIGGTTINNTTSGFFDINSFSENIIFN